MPLYEFRCELCGAVTEKLIRRGDKSPKVCPACGQSSLERVFSACAVRISNGSSAAGKKERESAVCSTGTCAFARD
jgi:putative FmdB family regulatory protein